MTHTPLRPARSTPAAAARPAARRRRSKTPWLVGGVLAVVVAAGAAYALRGAGAEPAAPRATATAAAAARPSGAEGAFSATVTGTECGVPTVGPSELPQRPTGQFCLVQVEVRNAGTEARLLDPGAQRAVDVQGRSYTVAEQAAVFLNDAEPSLLDEIAPGATVRGVMPFDVPKDAELSAFVLHDTLGSAGAQVPLSR